MLIPKAVTNSSACPKGSTVTESILIKAGAPLRRHDKPSFIELINFYATLRPTS
jgi:hypothetical protein